MKLTEEDLKLFKDKLLNDYSKEQLDILECISVEDIREYINQLPDKVYWDVFPILDDINSKLENKVDICVPCEIKAFLKYLFREIMGDELKMELFKKNKL